MMVLFAFVWLLVSLSGEAQVLWGFNFDGSSDLRYDSDTAIWYGGVPATIPPPVLTHEVVDSGDPAHENVLRVTVDSSANINNWYAAWQGTPVTKTVASYDAAHTFLTFDLLVYLLRPFHAKIYYNSPPMNTRNLQVDVMPTVTGSFQRFTVPLSAFAVTYFENTPPNNPTLFEFGIRGDSTQPDTTWPFTATNVFVLDNIMYSVSPPLSIANSGNTLVLSWVTNAGNFVLQQSSDFIVPNWVAVTNTLNVVSGQNQVIISPVAGRSFYRLVGP